MVQPIIVARPTNLLIRNSDEPHMITGGIAYVATQGQGQQQLQPLQIMQPVMLQPIQTINNNLYLYANQSKYTDCRNLEDDDHIQPLLKQSKPLRFDWENRWLRGDQYCHMLHNMDNYCQVFGMQKFAEKEHPENIYTQPENGQVYFVRADTIGSDFGFPRLGIKKRFKWKKMNFTTELPKRNPLVSYIVASAIKCDKLFEDLSQKKEGGPIFRMHAVILKTKSNIPTSLAPTNPFTGQENTTEKKLYICCHVRKVEQVEVIELGEVEEKLKAHNLMDQKKPDYVIPQKEIRQSDQSRFPKRKSRAHNFQAPKQKKREAQKQQKQQSNDLKVRLFNALGEPDKMKPVQRRRAFTDEDEIEEFDSEVSYIKKRKRIQKQKEKKLNQFPQKRRLSQDYQSIDANSKNQNQNNEEQKKNNQHMSDHKEDAQRDRADSQVSAFKRYEKISPVMSPNLGAQNINYNNNYIGLTPFMSLAAQTPTFMTQPQNLNDILMAQLGVQQQRPLFMLNQGLAPFGNLNLQQNNQFSRGNQYYNPMNTSSPLMNQNPQNQFRKSNVWEPRQNGFLANRGVMSASSEDFINQHHQQFAIPNYLHYNLQNPYQSNNMAEGNVFSGNGRKVSFDYQGTGKSPNGR